MTETSIPESIDTAPAGTLFYAAVEEFRRARRLNLEASRRSALFATLARLNALYMIARAGSGHIGSSFSCLDILSWLHLQEMKPEDVFFSSKGHDVPALYSLLIGLERLPFELLQKLRRHPGLPGHPDIGTPGIVANTGSLGMGVSKAKGMVLANRLQGREARIFVLTGDGELQEGQFWESLISAATRGLHEITVIVDHNKLQSDTFVAETSDLGDLPAKFAAFGWHVERCDGHDIVALAQALARPAEGKPRAIIADTIKGRGVSFMEHTAMQGPLYRFHSGAPSPEHYRAGAAELTAAADRLFAEAGASPLTLRTEPAPAAAARPAGAPPPQRLVPAYSEALIAAAERRRDLVALDADLVLDTGLIPFRERFPDRFFECGIAEQDMVSQAGAMALKGLLPVVHSFACFLAARPNEQIYNNSSERSKIVYVGSLAGLLPGGPGHSHQSVRDIAALAAMPDMTLVEPSCPEAVAPLLDWCIDEAPGATYLRLVSIPCDIPYRWLAARPALGCGVELRPGRDAVIIGYGPVMLGEAFRAAERLSREKRIEVGVVDLPWLNRIDAAWLATLAVSTPWLITIDNHYLSGGQGECIAAALADLSLPAPPFLQHFGLTELPVSGANDQVLAHHRLDSASLADAIANALRSASEERAWVTDGPAGRELL
jgi:transketolase